MRPQDYNAEQFYPTPESLGRQMAGHIKSGVRSILEPSAGKGDLIKAIKEKCRWQRYKFYTCEISPELTHILTGEGFPVVGEDFLDFEPRGYEFDAIVMNPPFRNGIDHFLKAWEIVRDGGQIICLLNETALNNDTKKGRLFRQILEDNEAIIERQRGAFKSAERVTMVSTCIVIIEKPEKSEDRYKTLKEEWQNDLNTESAFLASYNGPDCGSGLIKHDLISSLVAGYNKARDEFANVLEANRKLRFYLPVSLDDKILPYPPAYETFIDELRTASWNRVFQETGVVNYMTEGMKKEFEKLQSSESCKEFTVENIHKLLFTLQTNIAMIREKSVEEIFDYFTQYHKENRCHFEGWKTNDSYKVNKKVILPWVFSTYSFDLSYDFARKTEDIEKAICLMLGRKFDELSLKAKVEAGYESQYNCGRSSIFWACQRIDEKDNLRFKGDFGKWHESEFFRFKYFKKGTMHLEFKCEKVWEMFNQVAAQAKKWIGKKTQNERPEAAASQPDLFELAL